MKLLPAVAVIVDPVVSAKKLIKNAFASDVVKPAGATLVLPLLMSADGLVPALVAARPLMLLTSYSQNVGVVAAAHVMVTVPEPVVL